MIFLSNSAQCMGHNWIKHRGLSDKEKEELKISKITKYYSVVCACTLLTMKKTTKKFTAAADNKKMRRK